MAGSNGQGLMELADLISRREYNWALVRSRMFEEELVRSYADENNTEFISLADTIEALYGKHIISEKSRENLHNIRILGNKAAHEGDNDPQDAKNTYYMLKEEMQTFQGRNDIPERTPVMISRNSGDPDSTGEEYLIPRGTRNDSGEEETGGIDMSYQGSRRSTQTHQRSGSQRSGSQRSGNVRKKKKASAGIDLYTILKILIPLIIVVLLIILLMSIIKGSKKNNETEPAPIETQIEETEEVTTEAPETTAAPETEAPTEAPAVSYRIKGEGVNIRYADNPAQVYVQFDNGKEIGPAEDFTCDNPEYADGFVKFTYDGKELIVSKRFIEKAE